MTFQMCLLCFTSAFLLIHTSKAQGIPGYPPLYNVPKYVNQGLNAYRQTQQIAKGASDLGLPVPQAQKIVTNVALPLLPPAQKLATNVGLPLLPSTQRLGANVGLPLLPKIFPGGLPVLPQLPPTFAVGTKLRPLSASTLLLNTNPATPRISPLQIRSTGEETISEKEQEDKAEEPEKEKEKAESSQKANTEKEQANAAINPINEVSDDEFKEVVGSSGSLYNETTTDKMHQTKTRSPDNKGDELDYLSKAANPIDTIGSLIKKVGHGLKHTMEKVDTTLWPNHAEPEMKDVELFTTPFDEWTQLPENRNKTHKQLVGEWIDRINESRDPAYRIPEGLKDILISSNPVSTMKDADSFTMSFEEWCKLPENRKMTYKDQVAKWIDLINENYRIPEGLKDILISRNPVSTMKDAEFTMSFEEWCKLPENRNKTYKQLSAEWVDLSNASRNPAYRIPDALKKLGVSNPVLTMKDAEMGMRASNAEPEINPMNKLFESAAKLANSFIDAMSRSGTNRKDPSELGQTNNPMNIYWKEASNSAAQVVDSKYPGALPSPQHNNTDWQMVLNLAERLKNSSKDKDEEFGPFIFGTTAMTEKGTQFGTHPNGYFNGNQQMLHPYSPAFGGTYNQWNQPGYASPVFDPTANFAHSTSGFNSAGGYYKSNNPSEILSNPMAQYTAMYPVLSRTYRQMPPPPLPAYGRSNPIGGLAHAAVDTVRTFLGGRKTLPPTPPPPSFGRPPSQLFGIPPPPHVEPTWIDGPGSFEGRHIPPHGGPLIKKSGSSGNVWDSATGLADSITNTATNPGKINTDQILGSTGTIFNAAKDLAGNIGKVATNPSSVTNNTPLDIKQINSDKLLGSSKVGDSLVNQAVDMAGKIVNTALNPGMNGNGQLLQSLGPTYAGGFFPRSNPSGSIVNSATQLASQILNSAATNSGNIGKIPLLTATPAIGNYAGALPLGSILNSATKLAGDITNIATVPGKLLVR